MHGQDDIFGINAFRRFALQTDFDDLRYPEPQFAGHQDRGHIRGAASGAHRTEGAVGGGMGIRRDDDHAGIDHAGFRHDLVADAAVGVKVETEIILFCELPHLPVVGRALDVRAGSVVVKHESAPLPVPHFFAAHFIKGIDGLQIQVVDLRKVDFGGDDLAGPDAFPSAVSGEDLLDRVHFCYPPCFQFSLIYDCISYIVYDFGKQRITWPVEACQHKFSQYNIN